MEFEKKNIHMEHMKNKASVQMNLEEDHNISDRNPDAFRIIQKRATVKPGEVKSFEDSILVKGSMCYEVLYLTEGSERKICSISGEIPFEQSIHTGKLEKGITPRVCIRVENITARLIHSRKMNIRGILEAVVYLDELLEEELLLC